MTGTNSLTAAMFLWTGFLTRNGEIQWADTDADHYEGRVGAAMHIADVAEILVDEYDTFMLDDPDTDFPGVFDYEVSQVLGSWVRLNPNVPLDAHAGYTDHTVRLEARQRIKDFFQQSQLLESVKP